MAQACDAARGRDARLCGGLRWSTTTKLAVPPPRRRARKVGRSSSRVPPIRSLLDGALVSDGESLRVVTQTSRALVALKPGTTEPEPGLAEELVGERRRHRLDVQDPRGRQVPRRHAFDAEAVCYNFDRWFNFKGSRLLNPGCQLLLAGRFRRLPKTTTRPAGPGGEPLQEL